MPTRRIRESDRGENRSRKFKPRKKEVLQQTFDTREERSTSQGKGIFKEDSIPEYIPRRSEKGESNEVFIGPLDVEGVEGYHMRLAVHFRVGPLGDMYVCPQRYNKSRCPLCEEQQRLFEKRRQRNETGALSKDITTLYPSDCFLYLVLDMTRIDEGWKVWRAGKTVHTEVAFRTHDKKTGELIDLTDFEDGRTVAFEVTHTRGTDSVPKYHSFALHELDEAIPEELEDDLLEIVERGKEKAGDVVHSAIIQYLHIPTYNEIAEAFYAGKDEPAPGVPSFEKRNGVSEGEILEELDQLGSKIKLKQWAVKNDLDLGDTRGMSKEAVKEAIISLYFGNAAVQNDEKPDCFGEAEEYVECDSCKWLEDGCADETDRRRS